MSLKYAVLGQDGAVQSFGTMHDGPEAATLLGSMGAVILSDEDYGTISSQPEGWQILPGAAPSPLAPPDAAIESLRSDAMQLIDASAERVRLRFVTAGSAQALVYQAKRDESDRLLAQFTTEADSAAAGSAEYPMLSAEVGITASTVWGVAQVVHAMGDQWLLVAAAIETARLTAKAAIAAASTKAEVDAAMAAVAWPNPPS